MPSATLLSRPAESRPAADDAASRQLRTIVDDVHRWLPDALTTTLKRLRNAESDPANAGQRQPIVQAIAYYEERLRPDPAGLVLKVQQAIEADAASAARTAAEPPPDADTPLELALTLENGEHIDDEIAISPLVRIAEVEAKAALRELATLLGACCGHDTDLADPNPMRPAVIARALREAALEFPLAKPARLALLRELAVAVGKSLAPAYARQIQMLSGPQAEPVTLTLRLSVGEPSATSAASAAARPVGAASGTAWPMLPAVAPPVTEADVPAAPEPMAKLLSALTDRVTLSNGALDLIERLAEPARRIASADPDLWRSPDHPLWQLLDRVVAAGSVHDEIDAARPDRLNAQLEQVVQRLEGTERPAAEQLNDAADAVDIAVTDLLSEQSVQIAPAAGALHARLTRDELEAGLREQLERQSLAVQAPPVLRAFLLGSWACVLAHTATTRGIDGPEMKLQGALVDKLLAAATRPPGYPIAAERVVRLAELARRGLVGAGLPAARIDADIVGLETELRDPTLAPPARSGAEPDAPAFAATRVGQSTMALGLHDELPTVPIDTFDRAPDAPPSPAALGTEAWLHALEPGRYCRMFLLDRWMNTQLLWRSQNGNMFVFKSRHGGRMHSIARRALEKLRNAGLATSIERGEWIAQAMRDIGGGARA